MTAARDQRALSRLMDADVSLLVARLVHAAYMHGYDSPQYRHLRAVALNEYDPSDLLDEFVNAEIAAKWYLSITGGADLQFIITDNVHGVEEVAIRGHQEATP